MPAEREAEPIVIIVGAIAVLVVIGITVIDFVRSKR
jgi:hypothetical protein